MRLAGRTLALPSARRPMGRWLSARSPRRGSRTRWSTASATTWCRWSPCTTSAASPSTGPADPADDLNRRQPAVEDVRRCDSRTRLADSSRRGGSAVAVRSVGGGHVAGYEVGEVRPIADVEFGEDVSEVRLDRVLAHEELLADGSVGRALADQDGDSGLGGCEAVPSRDGPVATPSTSLYPRQCTIPVERGAVASGAVVVVGAE